MLSEGTVQIAWGMPSIKVGTQAMVSVWGFQHHNSVFPGPGVIAALSNDLAHYSVTKGTIHFDRDQPMPATMVKKIVLQAIAQLNARYPKKDGSFLEYYDNGHLKQRGKYLDGLMHGAWSWWRKDGSLMRTGSFNRGEKTGEWVTHTRGGQSL